MEPAGLAAGVVGLIGLFSTCLDIVERWDSYKDFGVESNALVARFRADKLRFRRWGQSVGIDRHKPGDDYHNDLDDPSIRSTIDKILQSIKQIDGDVVDPRTQDTNILPGVRSQLEKLQGPTSRKSKLGWALRGKARFLARVETFDALVQKLYDLVPPDQSTAPGQMSARARHANLTCPDEETSWHFDVQTFLADMKAQLDNEIRKDLDDWLDTQDPKRMYDNFIHRRLDGTCDWVLQRSEFLQWQSPSEDAALLWVNGPPGYGKTVLCARIIQHLSANSETPLAYFFFSSELESRADPFVVMRSWISQIMIQDQQAFNIIREKREATNGRVASQFDIEELFMLIAQNIPRCTFIVDGLDECTVRENDGKTGRRNSLSEFLKSLKHIISRSKSRFLIVSRNDYEIRESLNSKDGTGWKLANIEISPEDVESDATLFSQSIVEEKLANKTEAQRQEVANRIVDRCRSMFLGIKLLEPDLTGGKNMKQLQRIIDGAPNKLDRIYDRDWDRISNLEAIKRSRAFSILRWATFAMRPITIFEITEILLLADDNDECDALDYTELPDSVDEVYIKTEILEICGSLIEVREADSDCDLGHSTIHLRHFSVKQYIMCHMLGQPGELIANAQLQSSNEVTQHEILAKACIRYLDCKQVWQETEEQNSAMIQAFREYATELWHCHVMVGVVDSEDLVQRINNFFHPHNENWESWRKNKETTIKQGMLDVELDYGSGEVGLGNPLIYASIFRLSKTIDYLIDEVGLDVNLVDSVNQTALFGASSVGWVSGIAQLLRKGACVHIASSLGITPVYAAASEGYLDAVKLLLEHGSDVTVVEKYGWTPLNRASFLGHIEVVKLLLENGADLNLKNYHGLTPLNSASHSGHVEVVKLLVEKGADLAVVDQGGWTPLMWASDNGHGEVVKVLLEKGADLMVEDNDGWTALAWASHKGHVEIAQLLLEKGADITAVDKYRWTPLHRASFSGHVDVVKLLLKKGADLTMVNNKGFTPLNSASYSGHGEVVKLLLEKGADITIADINGWTPLDWASDNGHAEVVKLLLENGADTAVADSNGWTPLLWASYKGHADVTRLLLEKGADVTAKSNYSFTPLIYASREGHIKVVELLLEKGDEAFGKDSLDRSPFIFAIKGGQSEVFDLLKAKQQPNIKDHYGTSALSIAARFGREQMVDQLLAMPSTDINSQDKFGRTPFWWARKQGHVKIAERLLEHANGQDLDEAVTGMDIGEPASFETGMGYCDVCLASIYKTYYSCAHCIGGHFWMCLECYKLGAHCLAESHILSLCEKEGHL